MAKPASDTARVSADDIRRIWAAHRLGPAGRITATTGGARNESYIVSGGPGSDFFVRFNTRDPQWRKFAAERIAFDLLVSSGLPLPRVVVLDESRQVVPYDFVIQTRLPGTSVASSWEQLSPAQVCDLAWHAGRYLALIHACRLDAFGKLPALPNRPFADWPAYFKDYAQRYIRPARERGLIDDAVQDRLTSMLDRAHGLLARVTQARLVHSDYHYENILQERGHITAILDFEWAFAGDSSTDFVPAGVRAKMLPGSEAAFVEGYTTVGTFDAEHSRRIDIYRLFLELETAVTSDRDGRPDPATALAGMLRLLEFHEEKRS